MPHLPIQKSPTVASKQQNTESYGWLVTRRGPLWKSLEYYLCFACHCNAQAVPILPGKDNNMDAASTLALCYLVPAILS